MTRLQNQIIIITIISCKLSKKATKKKNLKCLFLVYSDIKKQIERKKELNLTCEAYKYIEITLIDRLKLQKQTATKML